MMTAALIPGRTVQQALAQDLADAQVPRAAKADRIKSALNQVGLKHLAKSRGKQAVRVVSVSGLPLPGCLPVMSS
jgi:ABC-type methionine transport system ATPase subunit